MDKKASKGFSLVEILVVVIIVAILMGLTASAAFSARRRSYVSAATVEAEQIAAAIKTFWVAERRWPETLGSATLLNKTTLGPLIGEAGTTKRVYLSIPEKRFQEDAGEHYLDPWGHPYRVRIDPPGEIEDVEVFESVVSFPNQFGNYYDEDWFGE